MRVCLNCHKDAHDDKPFCPYCGYKLDDDNLLYHYTSIDTLNAILSNVKHEPPVNTGSDSLDYYVFCLRATHWMFFNDPLEYKFFFEKLIRYFESDNDLNRYTDKLKTAIYAASGLSGMPYIISLSKNRDSLDMWRNYSKNGTGVAIGFKPNIIDQICNKTVFF